MRSNAGSEVFMRQDIVQRLAAIALANEAAGAMGADPAYVAGQRATVLVTATAFGIAAHEIRLTGKEETWRPKNTIMPY